MLGCTYSSPPWRHRLGLCRLEGGKTTQSARWRESGKQVATCEHKLQQLLQGYGEEVLMNCASLIPQKPVPCRRVSHTTGLPRCLQRLQGVIRVIKRIAIRVAHPSNLVSCLRKHVGKGVVREGAFLASDWTSLAFPLRTQKQAA